MFQRQSQVVARGNLVTSPRPASLISRTYEENCDSTEATRSGSDRQRPARRRTHAADRARNVGPLDQEAEGAAHSSRGHSPVGPTRTEGEEMINWRLAVPAILVAATVAGCITYFIAPAPLQPTESDQGLRPTLPNVTGRSDFGMSANIQRSTTDEHIDAFQRAAEAILRRAQNAKASAGTDEPLVTPRAYPAAKEARPIVRP